MEIAVKVVVVSVGRRRRRRCVGGRCGGQIEQIRQTDGRLLYFFVVSRLASRVSLG